MIIVLDTNVLVSGLLKACSNPGSIVRMVASGHIRLAYDSRIINEYREVLSRDKFNFQQVEIKRLIRQIIKDGELVRAIALNLDMNDPSDKPFLEVAMASSGKILVTGNIRHFPKVISGETIKVLLPEQFVSKIRKIN